MAAALKPQVVAGGKLDSLGTDRTILCPCALRGFVAHLNREDTKDTRVHQGVLLFFRLLLYIIQFRNIDAAAMGSEY